MILRTIECVVVFLFFFLSGYWIGYTLGKADAMEEEEEDE